MVAVCFVSNKPKSLAAELDAFKEQFENETLVVVETAGTHSENKQHSFRGRVWKSAQRRPLRFSGAERRLRFFRRRHHARKRVRRIVRRVFHQGKENRGGKIPGGQRGRGRKPFRRTVRRAEGIR